MSLVVSQTGPAGRVGEAALWATAGLVVLSLHVGAAAYLMREKPEVLADSSPPAAIMIELAPEPEAAMPEEEQISPDVQDQEMVQSEETQPVDEPQPDPVPEPMPEPPQEVAEPEPVEPPPQEVAEVPPEPTPPEPVVEEPPPEPEPQITETIPEPPPEPIEDIKPIEEQATAALENVEVPLPAMRPPLPPVIEKPPEEVKKPEPKKEQVKKQQKPRPQQQKAQQEMAEAKIQAKQSERTAASQNSTGFFSQSVSPAQWMTRVRTKIARYARKCPTSTTGIVTVNFSFDQSGNITSVSVARSSGDSAIDNYVTSAVQRASPIPSPPPGTRNSLTQPVKCE